MKEIIINCAAIQNPRQLHRALAEALNFPQWYGSNLDALHDCLTAIAADTQLTLTHFAAIGTFANGFRRVLQDAENENRHFFVTFQ